LGPLRLLLRRLACTLVALGAGLVATGHAQAQSWMHPELVDADQESEERSEFWEGALASDEGLYTRLVEQARIQAMAGDKEQRERALTALRTASASRRDKPEAFYWLGTYLAEDRVWNGCGEALAKVYAIDPAFAPEATRTTTTLDYQLGTCLLYAGDYEGAIEHYKRIITLKDSSAEVEQKLGEALMALGRLDEAIEFLESAISHTNRYEAQFILAVALDRAERLSESRTLLGWTVDRDRDLSTLRSADKTYAPADDEHYYLGLAYALGTKRSPARKTLALYHFRQYLALAPSSPWRKRALAHRDALSPAPFADDLSLEGNKTLDVDQLKSALRGIETASRACTAGQPGLLLRIDLTAIVGKHSSPWNVRATTLLAAADDKEGQRRAIECVEAAARKLPAPRLSGAVGQHASAHFSLLGNP
jgi:tetratricopeptide (TPR) repeat protein